MKSFNTKLFNVTFLCAVFFFAWSTQDKKNIRIPTPFVLKFRKDAEVCGQEHGVPASYLMKILDKTLPDELSSLKFFYCIASTNGFIDEKGRFVVDKMALFEVANGSVEDYAKTIQECNKLVKDDPIQTLDAVSTCLHKAYSFTPVVPK